MKVSVERKVKKGGLSPINVPYIGMEEKLVEYMNNDNNYVCKPSTHKKSPNTTAISNADIIGRIIAINDDDIQVELTTKGMKYFKTLSSPVVMIISSGRPELEGFYIDKVANLIIKEKS